MSTREQKKKQTKQAIMEAAITLFDRNGYEYTSIEQIAKAAGVGKGTVYGYFQTKREIIRGFCDYELEQIHQELLANVDPDSPVLEQMLTIYMTDFHHVTRNKEFGRLYLRQAIFPDEVDIAENLEIDEKYFHMLFPILERAQERGELRRDMEPLHLTAHFYGLFILILHAWYTGRIQTEEVEEAMRMLFQQQLDGIGSKPTTL